MAAAAAAPGAPRARPVRGGTAARRVGEEYREIQRSVDRRDPKGRQSSGKEGKKDTSPPTVPRRYPAPPLAAEHLVKPGLEREMTERPRYLAPDYKGSGKLAGMVALVTGGDSGIGRAVAVLFAREGADVAIVYLPEEEPDAQETRGAVEHEGGRCLLIPGDVSDLRFCREAVARTIAELGELDILVNNAAFQEHASSIEEITAQHFDRTIRTNLYGYFFMAKAALPHMRAGGSIINTGSITGIEGSGGLLDYSMTKGGIHAFTRSLAASVLDRGIRVNAVAPGPVWTPLNPADRSAAESAQFGGDTAMRRPAQPEEISPLYVFLAAPSCSSYITGEVVPIVGGPSPD